MAKKILVRKEIKSAEEGSRIRYVLDKLASSIDVNERLNQAHSESACIREAQKRLSAYCTYLGNVSPPLLHDGLSAYLDRWIQGRAYELHKRNPVIGALDNWIDAEDEMVELIRTQTRK